MDFSPTSAFLTQWEAPSHKNPIRVQVKSNARPLGAFVSILKATRHNV
jgi:hypothetical protein